MSKTIVHDGCPSRPRVPSRYVVTSGCAAIASLCSLANSRAISTASSRVMVLLLHRHHRGRLRGWLGTKRRSRGASRSAGLALARRGRRGRRAFLRLREGPSLAPQAGARAPSLPGRRNESSRAPAPRSPRPRGSAALNSTPSDPCRTTQVRDGKVLRVPTCTFFRPCRG